MTDRQTDRQTYLQTGRRAHGLWRRGSGARGASTRSSVAARLALWLGLAAALPGCALPTQGPSRQEVVARAQTERYELIPVTDAVARRLAASDRPGFSADFRDAPLRSPGTALDTGDRLDIRIFEAGRGGLFSSNEGNGEVALPGITVGPDGHITLPYTGKIQARGRTPEQVEADIVAALSGSAIEPQAVVEVAFDAGRNVTVSGAVQRPARVPLSLRGDRLSAVLVAAGGARHPPFETHVRITRRGRSSTASLQRVEIEDGQDIAMRPDDVVTLIHRPESYTVMGSVTRPDDVRFTEPAVSLLKAVGKSSGLQDTRADPGGVFLFRREPAAHLGALGRPAQPGWGAESAGVPTVYLVDFSSPKALFQAQSSQMRDSDVIYVANAGAVELRKALGLFGLTLGVARQSQGVLE